MLKPRSHEGENVPNDIYVIVCIMYAIKNQKNTRKACFMHHTIS